MTSRTDDLVRGLADNVPPVRPLASPWTRTAVWLGVSAPYLLALYLLWPHPPAGASLDWRFALEQIAALMTALTAGVAAFSLIVPGRSRMVALLPLAPFVGWIATIGQACEREWSAGGAIMPILPHWGCFAATVVSGVVPAMLMLVMLRRGAPLVPRLTALLGALAVAGLANVCVRFVHRFDSSFVVLTWHVAAILALGAALASRGEHAFNWRNVIRTT